MKIEEILTLNGKTASDKITGFSGTITGVALYISGCHQACLQPKVNEKGENIEARWFDVQRLDVAQAPAIVLENSEQPGMTECPAPIR